MAVITTGSTSSPDQEILRSLARRIDPADPTGHNNLGVLYFNKGMIEEAVDAFQRARDLSPAMRVAARNLEIAYLATGFYERAVRHLRSRLGTNPQDPGPRLKLARAHLAVGRAQEAAELLRDVAGSAPDDPELLREHARAELTAGDARAAQKLLERALAYRPADALLHYLHGEAYSSAGDPGLAAAAFRRAVEIDPQLGDGWYRLADVLRETGRNEAAEEAQRRVSALRPDLVAGEGGLSLDRNNPLRYEELVGSRAARPAATEEGFLAHYHAAVALRERGLYPEALKELELAEKAGEDPQLVRQTIAELLLVSGQVAASAAIYRNLVRKEEMSPKLWNELGVCVHRQGQLTEAEEHYRRALAIDAQYVIAANNLGVAQADRGELVRACGYFESAVEGAYAADALCNLGLLALRRGQRSEALASYRAALVKQPESGAAWVGVGAVLSDSNQLDEARHALAKAIELRPNDAEPRYHLAFVLNRLGDLEGSLRETRHALEIDPFYAAPRFRLLVDLHYEYAEILAPDLSTATRLEGEERVEDFAPAAREISSIFDRIEDVSQQAPTKRADYRLARSNLGKGLLDRAMEEAARAARAGGDAVEGALVTGEIFRAQGLFGEALERFDSALARIEHNRWGDQHAAAWIGRGWCLLALGHAAAAAEAASMVQSRDPAAVEPRRLIAEARLELGEYGEALSRFTRLAELLPGDAGVLLRVGTAAVAAGQIERGRAAFERALELDPDLLAARVELGILALRLGDPDAAADHASRALDGLPGYAEASLVLAGAERARGRIEDAMSALVDLLKSDPYHVEGLVRLGEILLDSGMPAEAMTPLKRALKFARENGTAWALLARANHAEGNVEAAAECRRIAIELGEEDSGLTLSDGAAEPAARTLSSSRA